MARILSPDQKRSTILCHQALQPHAIIHCCGEKQPVTPGSGPAMASLKQLQTK